MDAYKTDHTEDTLLMTTIPSRTIGGLLDPDGHSESIVLGPTKRKVVDLPQGILKPYPRLARIARVVLGERGKRNEDVGVVLR